MGRPVGTSSDGEEGDRTGQKGVWPWGRHLGDLSGSQQEAMMLRGGALRLSHPRRAGWLLPLGGQSLGEGFLPLAAGNPQRGLSRELATPQPSSWGKGVLPS